MPGIAERWKGPLKCNLYQSRLRYVRHHKDRFEEAAQTKTRQGVIGRS